MELNPWTRPEKRLELPAFKRLYQADDSDLKTLESLQLETKVAVTYNPNDETDYAVINPDGSVTRVCECITINGTQWFITPGKNHIPQSVYEFLMQCPEQRMRVFSPQPGVSQNLGVLQF